MPGFSESLLWLSCGLSWSRAMSSAIFYLVVAKNEIHTSLKSSFTRAVPLFILALAVISGCSDATGLLPRVNSNAQAQVDFAVGGTSVSRGAPVLSEDLIEPTIRLSGEFLMNPPDTAILTILNREKEVVLEYPPMTGDFTNPRAITSFNAKDLQEVPGLYYFRITFLRNNQEVSRQDTPFFFNTPTTQVGEVQSYPSPMMVGGYGLLQAGITPPQTTLQAFQDPFLRWTHEDGRVLAQGLLSEGFHTVPIRAPSRSGVFRVVLEIYPFGPKPGEIFNFPAPIQREFTSAVASLPAKGRTDFGPSDYFPILLHFNGTLDNVGTRSLSFESSSVLLPGLRGRTFGFEFLPDRYLTQSNFLLPLAIDGRLKNSSTLFLGVIDFLPLEDPIILFSSSSTELSIEYRVTSQGAMEAVILRNEQETRIRSQASVIPERQPVHLAYSIYRSGENDLGILLIADGIIRGGGLIPGANQPVSIRQGTSKIGFNLSGVIDEFGIYTGTNPEVGELASGLYRNRMVQTHGNDLQYAYSFEGLSGIEQEGLEASREVSHEPGRLIIPPGEWIAVPRVALESSQVKVFLGASISSRWIFGALEVDLGSELGSLVVGLDGIVSLIHTGTSRVLGSVTPSGDGELLLGLEIFDGQLILTSQNPEESIRISLSQTIDLLSFRVTQSHLAPGDLFLERIGVTRSQPGILDIIFPTSSR